MNSHKSITQKQFYSLVEKYRDLLPESRLNEIKHNFETTGEVDFSEKTQTILPDEDHSIRFSSASIKSLLLTGVVIGGIVWALMLAITKNSHMTMDPNQNQIGHLHPSE